MIDSVMIDRVLV